ncbi:MAG: hypothetical protein LC676_05410 [Loktanella sp.]|nr:hypothetical protein [Loktanella sp.]
MHMTPNDTFRLPLPPIAGRRIKMGVQKHFTGSIVFGDDEGRVMQFESHTEKQTALVMLARRDVMDLENQIPFVWTDWMGELRSYSFDFRVSYRDGTRIALVVKNSRKAAEADFLAETRFIARQVTPDVADRVSLVTERHLDPIEVHNAELIHSVRQADPETDAAVRRVVAGTVGAVKIADIVSAAGCSGRGFLAVVRMIRKHELALVLHERIEPEVFVRRSLV